MIKKDNFLTSLWLYPILIIFSILVIGGCETDPNELLYETNISTNMEETDLDSSDLDILIDYASMLVSERYPNAKYNGLVIFGNCNAFPFVNGRVTMKFVQTERGLLSTRYIVSLASIHTVKHEITLRAISYHYWPNDPQVYDRAAMSRILQAVAQHIETEKISNCIVELSEHDRLWNAKCTKENEQVCQFNINGKTGIIVKTRD